MTFLYGYLRETIINTTLLEFSDVNKHRLCRKCAYKKAFRTRIKLFINPQSRLFIFCVSYCILIFLYIQDVDYYGELENSVQGNEFNLYDQLGKLFLFLFFQILMRCMNLGFIPPFA